MDHEDTQLANERERPRSVQLRDEAINDVPVKQETEMEALIKKVTSSNQQAVRADWLSTDKLADRIRR